MNIFFRICRQADISPLTLQENKWLISLKEYLDNKHRKVLSNKFIQAFDQIETNLRIRDYSTHD